MWSAPGTIGQAGGWIRAHPGYSWSVAGTIGQLLADVGWDCLRLTAVGDNGIEIETEVNFDLFDTDQTGGWVSYLGISAQIPIQLMPENQAL